MRVKYSSWLGGCTFIYSDSGMEYYIDWHTGLAVAYLSDEVFNSQIENYQRVF